MSVAARAKLQPQTTGADNSIKLLDPTTEGSLVAYYQLNKFLQSFIDHVSELCLFLVWMLSFFLVFVRQNS